MTEVVTIGDATLYHGDAREILPTIGAVDAVITDPVWPNCPPGLLAGADGDQAALLADALGIVDAGCVVVVLGFNSDPRFLTAVPSRWPFLRSQALPYALPGYYGRLLGGDEMAFAFGEVPRGTGLIPGRLRTVTTTKGDRATGHPCPRADEHMMQLAGWWAPHDGVVLDPFMGTGATGVGCMLAGRRFVGIEIERRWFDVARDRIEAATAQGRLAI